MEQLERELEARAIVEEPLPTGAVEAIVCRLGDGRIALPLHQVQEVTMIAWTAPLPEAPPWIVGLLDLRGEVLPVIDVAARVDQCARTPSLTDHIVVCRDEGRAVGLLVQAVLGVASLDRDEAASSIDAPHARYVRAALRDDEGVVLLLSLRRLVALVP